MGSWTKPIERDHLRASIDYQQKVISNSAKTNQINSVSVCPHPLPAFATCALVVAITDMIILVRSKTSLTVAPS